MGNSIYDIVVSLLAKRIGFSSRPGKWQRLHDDLGATPLDLVLVALDAEDAVGVVLPIEELAAIRTVVDLWRFVSFYAARQGTRAFSAEFLA